MEKSIRSKLVNKRFAMFKAPKKYFKIVRACAKAVSPDYMLTKPQEFMFGYTKHNKQ